MADFHSNDSFLRNAKVTDFYLDLNSLPKIPKSISDDIYTIESRYYKRPDLLAHKLYGTTNLWWVFALRNPDLIEDPIRDFKSGIQIRLPHKGVLETIIG